MANELIAIRGTVTPVGWQPPQDMTRPEWEQVGQAIGQADKMMGWVIGDWLASGERKWGEIAEEAEKLTGKDADTLRYLKWISESVRFVDRSTSLSIKHHSLIAKYDPARQAHWLQQAEAGGWSVRELRAKIWESELPPPPVEVTQPPAPAPAPRFEEWPLPQQYVPLSEISQEDVEAFVPTPEEEQTIERMTALMSQQQFVRPAIVEREERKPTPTLERLKQLWREATEAERVAFREWAGW